MNKNIKQLNIDDISEELYNLLIFACRVQCGRPHITINDIKITYKIEVI